MRIFHIREVVVPVKSMLRVNWLVPGVMSRYTNFIQVYNRIRIKKIFKIK